MGHWIIPPLLKRGAGMENEVLRMQGITKIYSNGFVANKDVTFGV